VALSVHTVFFGQIEGVDILMLDGWQARRFGHSCCKHHLVRLLIAAKVPPVVSHVELSRFDTVLEPYLRVEHSYPFSPWHDWF
jgi:hypothetical protein